MTPLDQFAWMGEVDFDTRKVVDLLKKNPVMFLSWDVRKVHITERQVALRVFGTRFKGWVLITMATDQTYCVEFYSSHGKLKHQYRNITDESITHTIDLRIEHLPAGVKETPDINVPVTEDFA
jgi:hypothetical protein